MLNLDYQADLFVPSSRTEIDVNFFNKRFKAIFDQLSVFDSVITTYGVAESTLVQLGLARLNDTLGPLLTTLQSAAALGFLVCQASGASYSLTSGGAVGWTITGGADLFTPTTFLLAQDATDSTNWGILSVDTGGWVPPQPNHMPVPITTGSLATHVVYCTKTQASTSWSISANSAFIPAMSTLLTSAQAANTAAQAALASISSDVAAVEAALASISSGPVASVAGRTGIVVLTISDIIGLTSTLAGLATITQLNSKQSASSKLDALVNLVWAANKLIYATGASTLATADFTSYGQSLINATNAAAAISALGLAAVASSGSYTDLSNKPSLGTAAPLNVGTGPSNVVQLDSSSRLPAVNGSQLTNLPIPPAPPVGGFIQHNLYAVAGAQTITIPAGASRAYVRMVGGGGGVNSFGGLGATGGSGAYLEKWLTGLTPAQTLALTVGTAGSSSGTGTNGGNTTLGSGSQSIATLTAGGGSVGYSAPGAGGMASGGDFNVTGNTNIGGTVLPPFNVLVASGNYGTGAGNYDSRGNPLSTGPGVCCIDWFS